RRVPADRLPAAIGPRRDAPRGAAAAHRPGRRRRGGRPAWAGRPTRDRRGAGPAQPAPAGGPGRPGESRFVILRTPGARQAVRARPALNDRSGSWLTPG